MGTVLTEKMALYRGKIQNYQAFIPGIHIVANHKNEKNPITSTKVMTMTELAIAGSIFSALSPTGTYTPSIPAKTKVTNIDAAITPPIYHEENQT